MQSTVYKHIVSNDSTAPQYFLQTPEEWGNIINLVSHKCNLDVNQLYNMYMVLSGFYKAFQKVKKLKRINEFTKSMTKKKFIVGTQQVMVCFDFYSPPQFAFRY